MLVNPSFGSSTKYMIEAMMITITKANMKNMLIFESFAQVFATEILDQSKSC